MRSFVSRMRPEGGLADAPRDQLGVLGAEVDDEYQLVLVAHGTSV